MKDYREVADRVLRRSEEIIAENRRKKRARIKAGSLASCCCLAALLGFGVWQSGASPQETLVPAEQFAEDDGHSGESDAALDNGNSDLDGDPGGYSAAPDGEVSSGGEASEQDPASWFGIPAMPDNDGSLELDMSTVKKMISSYGGGDTEACYAVPENGTVGLSGPLRGAVEEYGDSVRYRVLVDLFRDGQALEMNGSLAKEESARLAALDFTPAVETYFDGREYHYYFTLHATMEQVTHFAASDQYGYMLFLYNERVPSASPDSEEMIFS